MTEDNCEFELGSAQRVKESPVRRYIRRKQLAFHQWRQVSEWRKSPNKPDVVFEGEGFVGQFKDPIKVRLLDGDEPRFRSSDRPNRARGTIIAIVTAPLIFVFIVMASLAVFGAPKETVRQASVSQREIDRLAQPQGFASQPSRSVPANGQSVASPLNASVSAPREPAPIYLPEGADVSALAMDGDRLAVKLEGPGGSVIVLYDTTAGVVLGEIPLVEQSGAAWFSPAFNDGDGG